MPTRRNAFAIGAVLLAAMALPVLAADPAAQVRTPTQTFVVKALKIDDLVGNLSVEVKDAGPTELTLSGAQWGIDRMRVRQDGDVLRISAEDRDGVWNWRSWFDFRHGDKSKKSLLTVRLVVPRGMAIDVDDFVGRADIGNTEGPLTFEVAGRTDTQIGNVARAHIVLSGSGKVSVGRVSGDLHAETVGSGNIRVGNAKATHAEISGAGTVALADVAGPLHVEIAGAGNFSAHGVNGPVHVEIAGAGAVAISEGLADPLHVETIGSGKVSFGGVAVNPHVEAVGSGRVQIKSYRGKLLREGNVDVKIGD